MAPYVCPPKVELVKCPLGEKLYPKHDKIIKHFNSFGEAGSGPGQLCYPRYLVGLPSGALVISDTGNHRVQIFDGDGKYVRTIGSRGAEPGQFERPCGLAVDDAGEFLYVVDSFNDRVQKLRVSDGSFVASVGGNGKGDGQLSCPDGCCLDDGELFVSDKMNSRVAVYTVATMTFARNIGAQGKEPGYLLKPLGVATLNGVLVVGDNGNDRVDLVNKDDGASVREIGECYGYDPPLPGRAWHPRGVATKDDAGITSIIVCEQNRLTIHKFEGFCEKPRQCYEVDAVNLIGVSFVGKRMFIVDNGDDEHPPKIHSFLWLGGGKPGEEGRGWK